MTGRMCRSQTRQRWQQQSAIPPSLWPSAVGPRLTIGTTTQVWQARAGCVKRTAVFEVIFGCPTHSMQQVQMSFFRGFEWLLLYCAAIASLHFGRHTRACSSCINNLLATSAPFLCSALLLLLVLAVRWHL
jgi:hypothetical protein